MSTSFPANDNICSFRPINFLATFSFKSLKVSLFDVCTMDASSKYLSCSPVWRIFIIRARCLLLLIGVFLLKKIENFSILTCCLFAASYCLNNCMKFILSLSQAPQNKKKSSVKKRWLTEGHLLLIFTPLISFLLSACPSRLESPSI